MKVLNFGSCNIDYVYAVTHMVRPGETLATAGRQVFPGGKGLNQSVALAKAGVPVFHAGCVGEEGGILRDVLTESGADLTYLRTVEEPTGHAIIQVDGGGENAIFLYKGANGAITPALIDEVLADFGAGDILLLQNEISNLPYLLKSAAKRQMTVILNPAPFNEEARALDLSCVSYLLLNETEAAGYAGCEDTEGCLAFFAAHYPSLRLVLTLGKRGAVYVEGNTRIRQPAFKVKAVDTTAAGDTFTGYFIAGLLAGLPMEQTLRRACAASGIAVSRQGAAPSVPTAAEVEALLPTMTPAAL